MKKRSINVNNIKDYLEDIRSFESNFIQMRMIGEKNHGEVFEEYGESVSIWESALLLVLEYENLTAH